MWKNYLKKLGDSGNEYEYAVPNELGKLLPNQMSPMKSIPSSPAAGLKNRTKGIQLRFSEIGVPEIEKHRLRMLRKLGEGTFGVVSENHETYKNSLSHHYYLVTT